MVTKRKEWYKNKFISVLAVCGYTRSMGIMCSKLKKKQNFAGKIKKR